MKLNWNKGYGRQINAITRPSFLGMLLIFFCLTLMTNNPLAAQEGEKEWEDFDPANFGEDSYVIDNDWAPLKPGMRYVYAGTTFDAEEDEEPQPLRVVIQPTDLVKEINGVRALVAYEMDFQSGELVEALLAFYAQDKEGNVWTLGEYAEEYDEEGNIDAAPIWLPGTEDIKAGIFMLANPWVGTPSYSQGWSKKNKIGDRGVVHEMGIEVCVPMGCYDNVLVVKESSTYEDGFQFKYWAEGVGNVQVGFEGDDPAQEILKLVDVLQMGEDMMTTLREKARLLEKHAYDDSKKGKLYGSTKPMWRRD